MVKLLPRSLKRNFIARILLRTTKNHRTNNDTPLLHSRGVIQCRKFQDVVASSYSDDHKQQELVNDEQQRTKEKEARKVATETTTTTPIFTKNRLFEESVAISNARALLTNSYDDNNYAQLAKYLTELASCTSTTPTNVEESFYLFQYLSAEIQKEKNKSRNIENLLSTTALSKDVVNTKLLNFIISNLCKIWDKKEENAIDLTPAHVLDEMDGLNVANTQTFNMIMDSSYYDKDPVQKVAFVSAVLKKMSNIVTPNAESYNTTINAYVNIDDAGSAEIILKQMIDSYKRGNKKAQPRIHFYTNVLSAWSRSKTANAPERAEELVKYMWNNNNEDGIMDHIKKSTTIYNTVLHCWAKSECHESGERAEAILREMESTFMATGDKNMQPDTISYSTVINAYATNGSALKAEIILKNMFDVYSTGNTNAKPNIQSFNTVLKAWSQSKYRHAPERAEEILNRMNDMANKNVGFDALPNVISYTAVLQCWAKSERENAAEKVEMLLREIERLSFGSNTTTSIHGKNNDNLMQLDTVFYSTIISAYARIGNAARAEQILKHMFDSYTTGKNTYAEPNVQTFTAVLMAWSKSRDCHAPERAEGIIRHMHDITKRNVLNIMPNLISYNTLLHCWAKSGRHNAGERTEQILREMERMATNVGDTNLQPDTVSYNIVISAYASVGNVNKCEIILKEMYESYVDGDNKNAKPDVQSFTSVLKAWSRLSSRNYDKAGVLIDNKTNNAPERVEAIIMRMHELTKKNIVHVPPDIVSYSILLQCWAISGRSNAGKRAESILRGMELAKKRILPDTILYNTVINAYINAGDVEQAERILDEMCMSYLNGNKKASPNAGAFNKLLVAWYKGSIFDRAEMLFERMEMLYNGGLSTIKPNENTHIIMKRIRDKHESRNSGSTR